MDIVKELRRDRESVAKRLVSEYKVFPGEMPEFEDEGAQEEIFRNLDHSLLRDAIQSLPREMKEVIVMHYLLEEPVARVAKFVGEPVSTVKWRLHVARKALGAKLGAAARKPGGKALIVALALAGAARIRPSTNKPETGKPANHHEHTHDSRAARGAFGLGNRPGH